MAVTGRHVHVDPSDLEPEAEETTSNKSRIIWTFADQALSSLANFALSIVVAREVSEDDFGSFSLMLVTFTFLIGLGRAGIGDPYVIRFTDADRHTRRRAQRQAAGSAISFGVVTGLVCAVAAAGLNFGLNDSASALAILGLGVAMPGLMLQETWRNAFFAEGRPRTATINDGVRTAIQFGLLAVLLSRPDPSVFLITLAWGAGALAAALMGVLQTRVAPDPFEALAWFRETRDINIKMAADFSFNQGATTLVSYVVGGIVGKVAIGAIRAAQTLLGPLNLLFSGISSFGLPMLSRIAMAGGSLIKGALLLSAAIGGMASTWVLILLVVPDSVGGELLGASWGNAREVMLPMGLITATVGFVLGASLGLKALRRADQMLRVTFVQAPLMLGLGSIGGWLWSAQGAAWGMAAAQVTGLVASWIIFIKADRLPRDWIGEEARAAEAANRRAGRGDDDRDEYGRGHYDERDIRPFWSQEEQDRWAVEEPEQLYNGQQAEEPWSRDERDDRGRGRDSYGPDRDPRGPDARDARDARDGARDAGDGWYDPTGPTVAVRQDGKGFPATYPPAASPGTPEGGYAPHDPTVAVRQDKPARGARSASAQGPAPLSEAAPRDEGRGGRNERGRSREAAGYEARDERGWDERGPERGLAPGTPVAGYEAGGYPAEVTRSAEGPGGFGADGRRGRSYPEGGREGRGRGGYESGSTEFGGPESGPPESGSSESGGSGIGRGRAAGPDPVGPGRAGYDTGGQGRAGYDTGGAPAGRSRKRDGHEAPLNGRGGYEALAGERPGYPAPDAGRRGYETPADGRPSYPAANQAGGYETPTGREEGRGQRSRARSGYDAPGEGRAYETPAEGRGGLAGRSRSRGQDARGRAYPEAPEPEPNGYARPRSRREAQEYEDQEYPGRIREPGDRGREEQYPPERPAGRRARSRPSREERDEDSWPFPDVNR